MATLGQVISTPEAGWQRIDDKNSLILYSGTGWSDSTSWSSLSWGGTTKAISNPTSANKIEFSFVGTKLRTYGVGYSGMNTGNKITIDGVEYPMALWSQIANNVIGLSFEITGLENKAHKVTIEYNGSSRIYLDSIDIDENGFLLEFNTKIFFLVSHSGKIKKFDGTNWVDLGITNPTENDFKTLGMVELTSIPQSKWTEVQGGEILAYTIDSTKTAMNMDYNVTPFKPFDLLPNTFGVESYVEGSTTANLEIGISPIRALDLLESKTPKLLMASTDTTKRNVMITSKPPATLILPKKDIDLANIEGIDSVAVTLTGTGGTAKAIVSFDSGVTWQVYRNGAWANIQATTEAVKTAGMTQAEVGAIPSAEWNAKNTKKKIRFGYFLEYDGVSSNLGFDKLSMTVDMKGVFKKAVHGTDYDYGYTTNTNLSVEIKTNGTYKINYPK